jgi:hypothetical protein
MADFTLWTAAAAPALEIDPGKMVGLLLEKQDEGMLAELDAPLPQAVSALLDEQCGKYEGLLADLLVKLGEIAGEEVTRHKSWPQNSKALRNALARLTPVMRVVGVTFQELKKTNKGRQVLLERGRRCSKGDGIGPKVTLGDGTAAEHRHPLTPQKQPKSEKSYSKGDGSDDTTPSFSLSLHFREKGGEERDEEERERVSAPPSPPSPRPRQRLFPNLLEGEL